MLQENFLHRRFCGLRQVRRGLSVVTIHMWSRYRRYIPRRFASSISHFSLRLPSRVTFLYIIIIITTADSLTSDGRDESNFFTGRQTRHYICTYATSIRVNASTLAPERDLLGRKSHGVTHAAQSTTYGTKRRVYLVLAIVVTVCDIFRKRKLDGWKLCSSASARGWDQ